MDEEYDVVGTKCYNIVQVLAYLILAADSVGEQHYAEQEHRGGLGLR